MKFGPEASKVTTSPNPSCFNSCASRNLIKPQILVKKRVLKMMIEFKRNLLFQKLKKEQSLVKNLAKSSNC